MLIGDSHTASTPEFGGTLQNNLSISRNGTSCDRNVSGSCAPVSRCALGSTTAYSILQMSDTDRLFRQNPSAVVIALGTNDAGWMCDETDVTKGRWPSIRNLIRKVPPGKPCFWVGPPNFPANSSVMRTCRSHYTTFIQTLRRIVTENNCTFIDSTQMKMVTAQNPQNPCTEGTAPLAPNLPEDPLHPHGIVAQNWAKCSAQQIRQALQNRSGIRPSNTTGPQTSPNPTARGSVLILRPSRETGRP